ncbi:MAG: VOC family protein [Candidatus Eisenbacteria bacterium]|uniref:VOC family protein n=1 Tax=Eiseniibacteriota bacterium TaxID=2212470 RepID=A0A849T1D0_UNCEI|nr:VOC family protein [Candidatus Eisenbacteria bacterium]
MSRVLHFEIPADDTARVASFYQQVFGWKFQRWEGPMEYWLVQTGSDGPGIDGGMMKRAQPGQGPVNTVGVPSLDDAMKAVTANGGAITVPRMAIPGVGWLAYAADTEGNPFGMMQADSGAA